ncbi:MAG: hypothetical protein ABGY42_08130 [bacterium]
MQGWFYYPRPCGAIPTPPRSGGREHQKFLRCAARIEIEEILHQAAAVDPIPAFLALLLGGAIGLEREARGALRVFGPMFSSA